MTTISNRRPVTVPTTTTTSNVRSTTASTASSSSAATGSSSASSFQAATGGPNTFSGLIQGGQDALKDVSGGAADRLKEFLSKYPTKSGIEQAKKDLESLGLSGDQLTAVQNALQAQQIKLGTQQLMNSIAEAVQAELKKSGKSE